MHKHLARLLTTILLVTLSIPIVLASYFPDVPDSHPNHRAINYLKAQGKISGFPDGTFRPDDTINRSQALKIALNGANIDCSSFENAASTYTDVPDNHTLKKYINCATVKGFVSGYGDGTYGPENPVTQGEIQKILLNIAGIITTPPTTGCFDDVPATLELAKYICYGDTKNLFEIITADGQTIQGGIAVQGNTFGINTPMKRANSAEESYRIITVKTNGFASYDVSMKAPGEI